MGVSINAKEVLENYQAIMGEELGTIFYRLYNKVIYLHQIWNNYNDLFGIEKSRLEIMNKSTPFFFYMVQQGLKENIIMSLARLTDPPQTGKFKNLSLRVLPNLIEDKKLRKEVQLGLDLIVLKAVEFARIWRSKVYAHTDYDISLGHAEMEEKSSIENIKLALKSIQNLMDKITQHYENSRTVYLHDVHRGGSMSLLYLLQDGLNCRNYLKKRKTNQEEIDPELEINNIRYKERELDMK